MNPSRILAVCKLSKLEYDKRKFKLNNFTLIQKYRKEHIHYDIILESHIEQKKCINLAKELLPETQFIYTPHLRKELTVDKDLIISIGGDEHFKYTIHNSVDNKLLLSIRSDNLKSEGALSACNRHNLNLMVEQIRNDSFRTEEWVRLDATLNENPIESAVDTIYIGEKNGTRMSRYLLQYRDHVEEQKSSGLLFVTGAGSTGWFKSAGGSPFPRNANTGQFITREIYVGTKTGSAIRNGEFSGSEEIHILSLMDQGGIVEIDSIKEYNFPRGAVLKVRLSKKTLRVMQLRED